MQLTGRIIADETPRGKLLAALLALLSLKCTALAVIVGAFLIITLAVFTLILDALVELCGHIAQVYLACTPIERLLIFVLFILFFSKVSPWLVRILRAWKGF